MKIEHRKHARANTAVYSALTLLGIGLLLLIFALAGCGSTSRITPATAQADRTTESRGPTTTLKTRVILPREAR